jgi:hypothetical protein
MPIAAPVRAAICATNSLHIPFIGMNRFLFRTKRNGQWAKKRISRFKAHHSAKKQDGGIHGQSLS